MQAGDYAGFREGFVQRLWDEVAPFVPEIEDTERIPAERLFPLLADMGAFALRLPAEHGGLDLSVRQYLPLIAEIAKVHGGIRALLHVHNSMTRGFAELADQGQRDAVLPGTAEGRRSVAFALTEPDHGTGADVGTTARRDGDHYVIDGRKWLITNSDFASHFMVFARAPQGVSLLLVERDAPGLRIEALPETMGCKGGEHGMLTFEGVRVPADALIGPEGAGLTRMERILEHSRVYVAASSLGTAERAFELALAHAETRTTFGKPLIARQGIQRYVAEMAADIHALRLMLLDVADKIDRGQPAAADAAMVKLVGLEAVGRVTDRALLVHGGIGYTRRHALEMLYRDARLNWLEEGPPSVQYAVVAASISEGQQWGTAW